MTAGALKVTKQRDMEGGESYGFALSDVYIGDDPGGQPIHSAVVDWLDAPKAESATKIKAVPASQRLLMDTIAASIDEAGEQFRPFADGPPIRAVSDEIVREKYYTRIAEQAEPGEDRKRLAARQRQSFNRSVADAIKAKRLVAATKDGARILWLP